MRSREVTGAELVALRQALLDWYDENRRELPWRATPGDRPDPYRVWLSEVMLQQTRVETVRPYFERWIQRFPTLTALGAASLDEVLKEWEGLGYYSRARNLHRAVREVADRYGGRVPQDPERLRALPGVGRYTAGAILSIAFGREEPVVDGNVRRVFARVFDDPAPKDSGLWFVAERIIPGERPGDLNQALMDFGATVCTSRSPTCGRCPIDLHCRARAAGTVGERPAPRRPRETPIEKHSVAVVRHEETLLLVRRPGRGRLGGLWEFPGVSRSPGESIVAGAHRAATEWAGIKVAVVRQLGSVDHAFSHVRVTYDAVLASPKTDPSRGLAADGVRWVREGELGEFALPRAQRRIAELL
ncbi:MAG: A/G-specific adenine glycosylase [Gemmatimonas sp.]|nr:A/G-specific adenine glycosylase [Gemmatimonas sp.]